MLTKQDVEGCELEAEAAYVEAGFDPDRPVSMARLCEGLFGRRPKRVSGLVSQACVGVLDGQTMIFIRDGIPKPRAAWLTGHETSHKRLGGRHGTNAHLEARCDLLGACLVAPRPAFLRLVKRYGHSVYDLAHALGTTQAVAMLRLGELTGRPVRLLGPRERVRGEAFDWPDVRKCLRGDFRTLVHPVRLMDERKWGLMAS